MSDLQVGETFQDRVFIVTTTTGVGKAGLAPKCTVIEEDSTRVAAANGVDEGNGWYSHDWAPDAAGTWATEWSNVNLSLYTVYYATKIFKVGGGEIADIKAETAIIDEFHDVPAKNAVVNAQINEVVGNKTDDPAWFTDDVSSLMRWAKAAVSTGGGLTYSGKCDTGMAPSTVTVVSDDLKGFGDDFFNTDWVMTVNVNDNSHGNAPEGNSPRDITDYVSLTGTFTVAAFSANVEAEDKILVQKRNLHHVDKVAIAATPTTDSFAYKISKYLADGDGDFATGTALPANTSLYDVLIRHEVTKTFFSPSQISVTVPAAGADLSLPTVTLPNITGTITHVYAGIKFRMIENTNAGANKLSGAQEIQVRVDTPGAWADAINFVDDQFGLAATTREGGDCVIGNIDLVGTVTAFNDGYNFQWDEAVADLASIVLNDVQTFLIVSYY